MTEADVLRLTLENIPHGICMFDASRRVVAFNNRYPEIIDIPAEAIRPGVALRTLLEASMAAGHYPGKTIEEVESELWPSMPPGGESHRIFHRNGKSFSTTQKITGNGCRVSTFVEITDKLKAEDALKESEARFRLILDSIPDCVKIFDEAGELTYINPAGLELLQSPDRESLCSPGYSPVAPDCIEVCSANHRKVIGGEASVYNYKVQGLLGRLRNVEAHAVPLRMPDGSMAQLCISRDTTDRDKADEALRRSEKRLRLVQEATHLAEFEADTDGVAIVSDRLLDQLGLPKGDNRLTFDKLLQVVDPRDRERLQDEIEASLESGERFQCDFRIVRVDNGETRWISSYTMMERGADGKPSRSIGAHVDITERKRAEEAVRESEERFRLAADAAKLGVWDYDPLDKSHNWSSKFRAISGIDANTAPSLLQFSQLLLREERAEFFKQLTDIRRANDGFRLQRTYRIRRADNHEERWIETTCWKTEREADGRGRIIITIRDVTDEKTASERISWAATHDALTGLPNRRLFQDRLELAIKDAKANRKSVGLLLLDLDQFKQINDTFGHDVGDVLLEEFADRLRSTVRSCDTVARLGGDEFAIVLPDLDGTAFLEQLAATIFDRFRAPLSYDGKLLECGSSVGASLYPNHGSSTEELLKHADIALYSAKSAGRGRLALFHAGLLEEVMLRSSMIGLGKRAVKENKIAPFYQPKIDLLTGETVGFEALLRWYDNGGTVQLPESIAAGFDDPEVASAISDRMLESAISDMRDWLEEDVPFGSVAFNASAVEFGRGNFAERVLAQLERAGVPPQYMQIEVTEGVFLGRGSEHVLMALKALNREGIKIALDDFGTGYASLRHLKEFPVETIKIDQSFVRDMVEDPGDEAIIRSVINLGRALEMQVIAEGIETREQARRLVDLGCSIGQGFLFSKALPANEISTFLAFSRDGMPKRPCSLRGDQENFANSTGRQARLAS